MRCLLLAAVLAAATPPVCAQESRVLGQRPTDRFYTAEGLVATLSDRIVRFHDGSTAVYWSDGAYSYTYHDGDPPFRGTWHVRDGGQVCVTFDNGFARCDTYVRSADKLVLIIASGDRFPVRSAISAH